MTALEVDAALVRLQLYLSARIGTMRGSPSTLIHRIDSNDLREGDLETVIEYARAARQSVEPRHVVRNVLEQSDAQKELLLLRGAVIQLGETLRALSNGVIFTRTTTVVAP